MRSFQGQEVEEFCALSRKIQFGVVPPSVQRVSFTVTVGCPFHFSSDYCRTAVVLAALLLYWAFQESLNGPSRAVMFLNVVCTCSV